MKYEKWSLGYWCLKQYIRFVDWITHKQVLLNGTENIPKDKPIIFAPNHQNALSDPLAILLHTKFQPVWLARADIFKKGIVTTLLRFIKIMPVYRMRDGKDQLAKNDKTFADSIKVLENNFALALFPEAAHSGKRQMLAHKKAVPRIAFMAEKKAKNNLDIHIVPVGIYYSSYWKFNRSVIVNFGEPIWVNDFLKEYKTNVNSAALKLRDAIYDAIEPLTINISSKNNYKGIELIREVYGSHFLNQGGINSSLLNRFQSDQKLVRKLEKLEETQAEKVEQLVTETKTYNKRIKGKGMRSWLIENPKNNFAMLGLNKLVLFLGLPIFLFGFIFNALPFFTIDTVIRKKIKDQAFWSTFFLVLGFTVFPIVYLLELWAISNYLPGIWFKLLFLFCLPVSGKLAFNWYILFLKTMGRGKLFFMNLFQKKQYEKLKEQQITLFENLDKFIYTNPTSRH